jgi:hypothetical protein
VAPEPNLCNDGGYRYDTNRENASAENFIQKAGFASLESTQYRHRDLILRSRGVCGSEQAGYRRELVMLDNLSSKLERRGTPDLFHAGLQSLDLAVRESAWSPTAVLL